MKTKKIVYAAAVAALYCVLTVMLAPISYGSVQVRVAEAMTVLPAVSSASIFGLFIGCFTANLFGGTILDIVFGSLTTLLAACLSYALRKYKWLVPLPPVILNGVIVGGYLTYGFGGIWYINMLTVLLGQFVSCYLLGMPLLMLVSKNKKIKEFFN